MVDENFKGVQNECLVVQLSGLCLAQRAEVGKVSFGGSVTLKIFQLPTVGQWL